MKSTTITLLLTTLLLSACGGESDNAATILSSEAHSKTTAAKVIKEASESGLAIGTNIKDLVKPASTSETDSGVLTLTWSNLVAKGYEPAAIMERYLSKLQKTTPGSADEGAIFSLMDEEFKNTPPNLGLAGKTVRLPGFVSPLDENDGIVGDFLLVPYFGSCIHSPPPPVSQTVLVIPKKGSSISLSEIKRPVWVIGEMKVERTTTDLAEAAYRIENARLEPYSESERISAK